MEDLSNNNNNDNIRNTKDDSVLIEQYPLNNNNTLISIDTNRFNLNKHAPPVISPSSPYNETLLDNIVSNGSCTKYPIYIALCVFSGFISDGIEMTLMVLFIIPLKAYFNLSDLQIQALSASLFFGVAIGSLSSGYLTKQIGRTCSLKYSYFVLFISHLMMAISLNVGMFLIFRLFIGIALGIIVPVSLNLYSEYLPIRVRGFFLLFTWSFFNIGLVLSAVIMYWNMPHLEMSMLRTVFTILTLFPLISLVINLALLNDSPRSLILNNKYDEAFMLLTSMNHGKPLSEDQKRLIISNTTTQANDNTVGDIKELFQKKYLLSTILCISLFFIAACTYYGLYTISTLTVQEMNATEEEVDNKRIVKSQIAIACVCLFAYVIGGLMAEIPQLGRKGVIWIWALLNAIFIVPATYFPKLYTLFFAIAMLSNNIWVNVLITYIVEIFPTKLRDTSSGFLLMTFRVSCFVSQFLYLGLFEVHFRVVYYLSCIMLVIAIGLTLVLPFESVNMPLDLHYVEEKPFFMPVDNKEEDDDNGIKEKYTVDDNNVLI